MSERLAAAHLLYYFWFGLVSRKLRKRILPLIYVLSQVHAALNVLLLIARLQFYVSSKGKNSLIEHRGILVSELWISTIFLHYTILILIYDVLSSFRLYYIQFMGIGGRNPDMRAGAGARITQAPFLKGYTGVILTDTYW